MLNKKDIILFYTKARLEDDVVGHYMGFLWWLLDPALSAMVYYVVFDLILHRGRPDYIPFLFVGIVVWKWFQTGIKLGSNAIASQKNLYKKVYLPKIIFPWIEINFTTIKFCLALLIILISYPLLGYKITLNHLYLPVLILCQFIFTLGLSTFIAALTPFFPDFNMLISHILRLAFYPSGVLFSIDRVPERFQFLIAYNPMAQAVDGFRNIVMHGAPPTTLGMTLLLGVGIFFYGCGHALIQKFEGRYAKLL